MGLQRPRVGAPLTYKDQSDEECAEEVKSAVMIRQQLVKGQNLREQLLTWTRKHNLGPRKRAGLKRAMPTQPYNSQDHHACEQGLD